MPASNPPVSTPTLAAFSSIPLPLLGPSSPRINVVRCWNFMCIDIVPAKARCSVRRWHSKGVAKVTLVNQVLVILYVYFAISPSTLYALYYARKLPAA
mmetsp:Transcript_5162/g.12143  ORF Transcript_5162/g.12143 Transcript_5162/m.12143 type:complete len:98 (-) Transcript_5162:299-592(-)